MNLVLVRDLYKSYFFDCRELPVLKGLSLQMDAGQTVAVIGPSGEGKSTLLHLLGALDRPTSGVIEINGTNIVQQADDELAKLRSSTIGFVFQFHHLLPELSASENVLLAGLIAGGERDGQLLRAEELLERVGLAQRKDHKPGELSGGEQQRVALARALQNNPPLILADEPTGNLDRGTALSLQELIFELSREQNLSFLIVTHDQQFAARCDRILRLSDGRLIETSSNEIRY